MPWHVPPKADKPSQYLLTSEENPEQISLWQCHPSKQNKGALLKMAKPEPAKTPADNKGYHYQNSLLTPSWVYAKFASKSFWYGYLPSRIKLSTFHNLAFA